MRLQDYPRPPEDNGIGMHWSGGNPGAIGTGELRDKWIPELQRMGVKWVKFLHDGGVTFAELLLNVGIMPIVRLYRYAPNSQDMRQATLGQKEIDHIDRYVALGVKYFEFNNEPELGGEWTGSIPENSIDFVARAAIIDMETILSHGGYPGVPATAIGTKWDLIGKIIEHGGRHLFNEAVWVAIHNYDINHPVNYPFDEVNQHGKLISQEEYDRLGKNAWIGPQWGIRDINYVNEQRKKGMNPGHTVQDDPSTFRAYEWFADLCLRHLGRYIPILSTENGPIVNEDYDPRYPTTTPEIHAEKVVEQAKIMMGTSERYPAAPPYYFCTAFWLMGSMMLHAGGWEDHAWFSNKWPQNHLPAVDALAALPKIVRPLPTYPGEPENGGGPAPESSSIAGILSEHPNTTVILRSTGFSDSTLTDAMGMFRFDNLPAGTYRLSVPGTEIVQPGLELDGYNQLRVDVGPEEEQPPQTASGWVVTVEDKGASPGFGIIRVSVEGKVKLPVRISADGWEGYSLNSGSKLEYGPFALEFSPLGAGRYTIEADEIDAATAVEIDGSRIVFITFAEAQTEVEPEPKAESVISGRVSNGGGRNIILVAAEGERAATVGSDEVYRFTNLAAGTYSLYLPGTVLQETGIELDGLNQVAVDFDWPLVDPIGSTIEGVVTNGGGYTIVLRGTDGDINYVIGADGSYRFEGLAAGTYSLLIPGTTLRRSGLQMDGSNQRTANFTAPDQSANRSVVRGTVPGGAGTEVVLQGPDDLELSQTLGADEQFSFENLAAGDYLLLVIHADGSVSEGVELDGTNEVSVTLDLPVTPDDPIIPDPPTDPDPPAEPVWVAEIEDGGPGPGYAIIRARIDGQPRLPVHIRTHGWGGMIRYIGEKPEYGEFVCEFSPLGGGEYYIVPEGLGIEATVPADGSRIIWVTFKKEAPLDSGPVTPQPTPKTIDHYVLVGAVPVERADYLAALHYVARFRPELGDSLAEAAKARHVTILGGELMVSRADEAALVGSGSEVERLSEANLAAELQRRLDSGRAF